MTFENVFIVNLCSSISFGHILPGLIWGRGGGGGVVVVVVVFHLFNQYALSFLGLPSRPVPNKRAVKMCQGPYNET